MTQNHRAIAAAHLVKFRFADEGKALNEPLPTITSGGNYQRRPGRPRDGYLDGIHGPNEWSFNTTDAKSIEDPMTTVTNTGSQQQLVSANLVHLRGNCDARDAADPLHTISAGGTHHGLVTASWSVSSAPALARPWMSQHQLSPPAVAERARWLSSSFRRRLKPAHCGSRRS